MTIKRLTLTVLLATTAFWVKGQDWNFNVTVTAETCFEEFDGEMNINMTGNTTGRTFTFEVFREDGTSETGGFLFHS